MNRNFAKFKLSNLDIQFSPTYCDESGPVTQSLNYK